MNIGEAGIRLIKNFEGCRLMAYRDSVGVLTIGYGNTHDVSEGQTITQEQAEHMLNLVLSPIVAGINGLVTVTLTQNQFDALCSFTYNLGIGTLARSALLKMLNSGDYFGAAKQFERFDEAGGMEVAGLLSRRKTESETFRTPDIHVSPILAIPEPASVAAVLMPVPETHALPSLFGTVMGFFAGLVKR